MTTGSALWRIFKVLFVFVVILIIAFIVAVVGITRRSIDSPPPLLPLHYSDSQNKHYE